LALLAGRKLLLADDSITIQKVVDLTFADEGVNVISVGNGRDAIERLEEIAPDVVLADVFMPEISGYEVCEYIKHNEKLKHIPVMLLVGSFEPFDEAEARRVGADDILTKPFQSIRKLIDKVGVLMTGGPAQEAPPKAQEAPTAELPKVEQSAPAPERLSTAELEMTTADTQRMPEGLKSLAAETASAVVQQNLASAKHTDDQKMDTPFSASQQDSTTSTEASDVLLDLGDFQAADDLIGEEFVLDLDMNDIDEPEPVATMSYSSTRPFVEPHISESRGVSAEGLQHERAWAATGVDSETYVDAASEDQFAQTQEFTRPDLLSEVPQRVTDEPEDFAHDTARVDQPSAPSGKITLDQLSPEAIDAIAKRAVEMLSEKVVQEIAWEVVPQLSELIIKRQLEEKKP
jgi:CheY-like chemotaxis protein